MFSTWKNADKLQAVYDELIAIDPNLCIYEINGFDRGFGKVAHSVSIRLRVKGNAKLIKELKAKGWETDICSRYVSNGIQYIGLVKYI